MDEFTLSEQTVKQMQEEYEKVLPPQLKASFGTDNPRTKKEETERTLSDGWRALYSYCKAYAEGHSFSSNSRLFHHAVQCIESVFYSRFNSPIVAQQNTLDGISAYLLAVELYLILPSPDNAVIMTTIALSVR